MIEPGNAGIVAPKHYARRFFEVGGGYGAPECISVGVIFVPITDFRSIGDVGTTENVGEALDPANVV